MQSFLKSPKKLFAACLCLFTVSLVQAQLKTTSVTASDDLTITYPGYGTSNGTTLQTNVTTASSAYKRIALKFNLSSIPSDAVIVSATLTLTMSVAEGTSNMLLKRITTTVWTESSTTLNPSTTTTNQVVISSLAMITRSINVLPLVKDIVNSGITNNGWLLSCTPESTVTTANTYHSTNAPSNKPSLVVVWYRPYDIHNVVVNNESSAGSNNGSIAVAVKFGSANPSSSYELRNSAGSVVSPWSGTTAAVDSVTTFPTFTGLPYGWYGLKVTGAYDVFYMAFLVGVNCQPVSILFNPGPDYIDDAVISSNNNSNDGASLINTCSQGGGVTNNSLIRFRLWMHSGLRPIEAKLTMKGSSHLYANGPNDAEFLLNTGKWTETTVTKNNDPAVSSSIAALLPATTSLNQDQVIEISNFWNYWKANNRLNYGMSLQYSVLSLYDRSQRFHSSDAASSSNRPTIQFLIDDATCDRTSHAQMKTDLDGGYATTHLGKLKFYFDEEYAIDPGKKVPLKLYDENHQLLAAIGINGQVVLGQPLLPALTYTFGDNRHLLDLTSYSLTNGKFYELELTRSTGEKLYLKFIYLN